MAKKQSDMIRNTDGTRKIVNGDFAVNDASLQHVFDITVIHPGGDIFNPTIGLGLANYIEEDVSIAQFKGDLSVAVERDGGRIVSFKGDNFDNISVNAEY